MRSAKRISIDTHVQPVRQYGFTVSQAMKDWKQDPVIVREKTIATYSITLKALGKLGGNYFLGSTKQFDEKKIGFLKKLE